MKSLSKSQGVTLLMVLVIVALSTLIAAQLIEHGTYSHRRTELTLAREQAYQLALGGEALAQQWIGQGFKEADKVHLGQPWATTPFEFPIEGGMIKASVTDAQTCFNINSLLTVENNSNNNGGGKDPQNPALGDGAQKEGNINFSIFEDILNEYLKDARNVQVDAKALRAATVDWLDSDIQPTGVDGAEDMEYTGYDIPYRTANSLMASKSELRLVKGFTKSVYKAVKGSMCALPQGDINKINVNTLLPEQSALLAGVLGISTSSAQEIISERPEDGYDQQGFSAALPSGDGGNQISSARVARVSVTSDYFFVKIEVNFKGSSLLMTSLMKRSDAKDEPFKVLARYYGDI